MKKTFAAHAPFGAESIYRVVRTLSGISSEIGRKRRLRRTIAALEALGDDRLADLGILRSEIETQVRGRI